MKGIKKVIAPVLSGVMLLVGTMEVLAAPSDFSVNMDVDGYPVECAVKYTNLDMDIAVSMTSSWDMEMEINGVAICPLGTYDLYAYGYPTYGIRATRHTEYGFDGVDVICYGCTDNDVSNQIHIEQ